MLESEMSRDTDHFQSQLLSELEQYITIYRYNIHHTLGQPAEDHGGGGWLSECQSHTCPTLYPGGPARQPLHLVDPAL